MSRKYQGLIVLNTKSLDGTVDELVSSIAREIEAEGGKIDKVTQLGRRQFAYNARHLEAGHYVNYVFTGVGEVVSKLQARLRLNGKVHLQHFQRIA
ncbi:MAG: 30S ribosomal protein S6 [Verrucomicrobia bacterium]|nr:30S ribosomal protein S6 [Verrucomicrobiota bacterium]